MHAFSFGWALGEKLAAEPSFLQSYGNVLDRWYNPWTKQRNYERGEKGLMRAGQAALGIGAAAGAAAGGLAAAPAIAGMGTGTAATAGTGGVLASQTPAGQNLMQRLPAMAQNAAHTYSSRVEPALRRVGYGPTDAAHDLYAVGTGNFDRIKGPNWGVVGMKPPSMNTVTGAPSGWTSGLYPTLPRPTEVVKNIASAVPASPVLAQAKL
jgi:hypothetical protein